MSVKIVSESAISRERTLVYQTLYENFVVLIQQKKIADVWTVYQHCLIPKLFINAITALPSKMEPSESSIITSGGFVPPKTMPAFENHDVDTLTDEVRRIFYRYDCECVPLCENQLEHSIRNKLSYTTTIAFSLIRNAGRQRDTASLCSS